MAGRRYFDEDPVVPFTGNPGFSPGKPMTVSFRPSLPLQEAVMRQCLQKQPLEADDLRQFIQNELNYIVERYEKAIAERYQFPI